MMDSLAEHVIEPVNTNTRDRFSVGSAWMGELVTDSTLSANDGMSSFGNMTALAESPRREFFRRLNLAPPAVLRPAHQAMLDALSASGDFDSLYRRQQLDQHQAALKIHSDFAARGESPTLRPVARNAAVVVRRHLDQLRSIR